MRKILTQTLFFAAMLLTTAVATAQSQGFSYQAVVRNAQGDLVANSKVGLRLTLTDQTGKPVMYRETHKVATNNYGVLSVTVGKGTAEGSATLDSVNWASGNVWMRVEMDVIGGT